MHVNGVVLQPLQPATVCTLFRGESQIFTPFELEPQLPVRKVHALKGDINSLLELLKFLRPGTDRE